MNVLMRRADIGMFIARRSNAGYALYDEQHDHNSAAGVLVARMTGPGCPARSRAGEFPRADPAGHRIELTS